MPQSDSSSPYFRAAARMAASTAYMCFRSASDCVYSCIRASASSREGVMGTLGRGCEPAGRVAQRDHFEA